MFCLEYQLRATICMARPGRSYLVGKGEFSSIVLAKALLSSSTEISMQLQWTQRAISFNTYSWRHRHKTMGMSMTWASGSTSDSSLSLTVFFNSKLLVACKALLTYLQWRQDRLACSSTRRSCIAPSGNKAKHCCLYIVLSTHKDLYSKESDNSWTYRNTTLIRRCIRRMGFPWKWSVRSYPPPHHGNAALNWGN